MRNKALLVVNSLLFISIAAQLLSGFLLRSLSLFRYIHLNNPPILIVLILLHLTLNWWWIKQRLFNTAKKDGNDKKAAA